LFETLFETLFEALFEVLFKALFEAWFETLFEVCSTACSRACSRLCSRDELCVRADARRAVLVRRGDEQGIHVPPGTLFVAIQREVVTGEPLTTRVTLH